MEKTPLILSGPPGCGKSYWIQKYAETTNKQLFVCPCRKDRTLRDGRQKLHIWARRTEPSILWLEGADDLTPEAQAFLRRILETHAPEVWFILECRDAGRLQEPIRSRCGVKRLFAPTWSEIETYLQTTMNAPLRLEEIQSYLLPYEYSYRRAHQCAFLQINCPEEWSRVCAHRCAEQKVAASPRSDELLSYLRRGYHPEHLMQTALQTDHVLEEYGTCMHLAGSLWAFLGSALDTAETTTANEEE